MKNALRWAASVAIAFVSFTGFCFAVAYEPHVVKTIGQIALCLVIVAVLALWVRMLIWKDV